MKLKPADFRINEFDPSIQGVSPLTQEGTDIPKGKEEQVRDAAERSGIELIEVDAGESRVKSEEAK